MPASIGVNLRVTGHCSQGGRKYMEDLFSVAYQQTEDERDLEYAFFGIYDGHGGSEAAAFAKEHLMDSIVKQRQFWSDNDEDVLKAIRNGYMMTHLNMWKELEKWPKTVTGLPSTAGTTASVAFIRRGKIYIGHVGDSAIVLGYQKDGCEEWAAKPLTSDHKPESTVEIERIQQCGGKVVSKSGVPRVVWNRPRFGHKGPIKKNTPMDEIPFLAVARSLGDLWSYNPQNDEFIVSPDPDVGVLTIDPTKFRCLIFGTDGLWNMISPEGAVSLVQATEQHNEAALVGGTGNQPRDWLNPSKSLVDHALERWSNTRMRADNTSVVTLMLDPPGPPRATVLRSRTTQKPTSSVTTNVAPAAAPPAPDPDPARPEPTPADEPRPVPQNGLTIMTRYSDVERPAADGPLPPCASLDARLSVPSAAPGLPGAPGPEASADDADALTNYGNPAESYFMARSLNRSRVVNTLRDVSDQIAEEAARPPRASPPPPLTELAEPPTPPPARPAAPPADEPRVPVDGSIQINEVSSSSPVEGAPKGKGRRLRTDKRDAPAAPPGRVLRSHDDPRRLERVVILSRRAAPPPPPDAAPAVSAAPAPAAPPAPAPASRRSQADTSLPDEDGRRATRSQAPAALAQKITRSISGVIRAAGAARPGNGAAARRGAARRAPARAPTRSKENLGAARRPRAPPGRARAAPGPAASPPDDAEVHSTTGEPCAARAAERGTRALRSRNEPATPPSGGKRTRCAEPAAAPAPKTPRLGGERCARALGKRASGPWAPALALRNRLRRRLAK